MPDELERHAALLERLQPILVGDGPGPSVHHLEDALALEAWFNDPPDLGGLLDGAASAAIEASSATEDEDLI